jgi:Ca-activated chloride channel homolog
MKRLGTVAVIAGLLLATALFFRFSAEQEEAPEPDEPASAAVEPAEEPPPEPKDDDPVTDAVAEGTLTMKVGTSHGYLASGEPGEVFAAIDIDAKEIEGGTRPPLNVAVVIDRSGSMRGHPMQYARQAADQLVGELQPGDRLSVVTYASDVSVDLPSAEATQASQARMRQAISRISAGGGTNISGGLQKGVEQVERYKTSESVNRVVLMSDGQANVGITSRSGLEELARNSLQKGISVTTMGMGLNYNEDVMSAMADKGSGNYYFIDQSSQIVSVFKSELDGLAETVARNTSVVITLPDGVEVDELYGFSHQRTRNQVMVSLAEFRSGESKDILLKLRTDAGEAGERPLMDVDLDYDDVTDDEAKSLQVGLASVITDDIKKTRDEVNTDVIARVEEIEVANSLNEAMAAYDRGETERAQSVLRKRRTKTRQTRKKYKLPNAAKFDKAEQELESTADSLGSTSSGSAEGKRMIKSNKARGRMIMMDSSKF